MAMSERLLTPIVNRVPLHPSEVGLTFWVDPRTDLTGFLKAGLEELLRVWDAHQAQMKWDSDE